MAAETFTQPWFNLIGIAVGLAMDAFAVSIAAGLSLGNVTFRPAFRLAWHFGLFQFLMPILGWWVGSTVAHHVAAFDHWLAFGLLAFVGGKMILDAFVRDGGKTKANPTRGWMLVALSIATSIDAFAVGLSMAFLNVSVLYPAIVIGLVAFTFTAFGIGFAGRLFRNWGRAAHILGGIVLIAIGLRVVISHTS
ncbi:MAG TPA: manganese efflux pump MntP family protein [Phycisphaerae bacterium]|nr:manganese efflux pump MntP family protein [Phycisphaerae bacterium]